LGCIPFYPFIHSFNARYVGHATVVEFRPALQAADSKLVVHAEKTARFWADSCTVCLRSAAGCEVALCPCVSQSSLGGIMKTSCVGHGTRPEPFNSTPMGADSVSFGPPLHVRPMGRTCGEPN